MYTELEIAVSGCGLVGGHFLNVFVTKRCGDSTSNCQICVQHIKLDRKQRLLTAKNRFSASNYMQNS